jgi:hypothetical protein
MAALRSPRRDRRQPQPQQRRRHRRGVAAAVDDEELLPAVQSLLAGPGTNYEYTETPRWRCTLGIPSGATTANTRQNTNDYHRYYATWATAPLLIRQHQSSSSSSSSSSYSIGDHGCNWVVAATTDGTIFFWWLPLYLFPTTAPPQQHDATSTTTSSPTTTTASGWNNNVVAAAAAVVPPTQSVSVISSDYYYQHKEENDDDDDDNDDAESSFDRVIRLIYLEKRSLLLAVTILGNVFELTNQPYQETNNDETTTTVPSGSWAVQNQYSTGDDTDGGGVDDDDAMNIRHAIVWSNDDDISSTEQPQQHTTPRVVLVYTTDSHIMAWEVPTATTTSGSSIGSRTGTLKKKKKQALSLLWKHAVEDITGLELLGRHLLVLAHHNGRSIQVLDLSLLLSLSSLSSPSENEMTTIFMDATVLARPGYELETITTTTMMEGPTILYRRPSTTTIATADDPSCVVIAFADGRCAILAVMDNNNVDTDGNGNIVEWGVLGTAPVTLPVPAVGIGSNRWGDIIYCLPAGSTIVQDITTGGGAPCTTAAWMLPVGTFSGGEHQLQQVEDDIMVPVEGFASANGYCVYQWPNGVMDVFAVQSSTEQLLQALVDAGVARDLVQWLCQSSDHQTTTTTTSPVASTTMGQHLARARTELLSLTTTATDRPMEELFMVAPTLRRCLLLLTQSE